MNASKENARKAQRLVTDPEFWSLPQGVRLARVQFLREFLDACVTRLPREASYRRDKKRRKEKVLAKA